MRICRFDHNRFGLVEGDHILDVTGALEVLPAQRYPFPGHDVLIENLPAVLAKAKSLAEQAG